MLSFFSANFSSNSSQKADLNKPFKQPSSSSFCWGERRLNYSTRNGAQIGNSSFPSIPRKRLACKSQKNISRYQFIQLVTQHEQITASLLTIHSPIRGRKRLSNVLKSWHCRNRRSSVHQEEVRRHTSNPPWVSGPHCYLMSCSYIGDLSDH